MAAIRNAPNRPGPFMGENMICVICGVQQHSDPTRQSNWRCVELGDGTRYYACPGEFPPDGATTQAFEEAYTRVFVAVIEKYRMTFGRKPKFKGHSVDGETEKVNDD